MKRVAIVTGVSRRSGIGFAIARRLADLGLKLLIQGWSVDDEATLADPGGTSAVLSELREAGAMVEHCDADLSDPDAPTRVLDVAMQAFGRVDVLVANHAYSRNGSLAELTAEQIDRHMQVNVRGSLLLVKEFADRHDGSEGGRVILLTSGQHRGPMRGELAYAASKGALLQITASLADELVERGITVNTVNPGPTDTGWASDEMSAAIAGRMPMGRWGQPDDAARLIAWLSTEDARWVTGQVIDSEGGFRR
ncbi:MAG: SDR family oxidoreductase [bacterium]|nr:SDR family oxidoreductase [bacterium]